MPSRTKSRLPAIIRHEFKLMAANKAFVILTILGPFLILAITVLPGLLSMNPKALSGGEPVGVSGGDPGVLAALEGASSFQGRSVVAIGRDERSVADAKKLVLTGKLAALVTLPPGWEDSGASLYTKTGTDAALYGAVEHAVDARAREARIARSGVDPALARELARRVELSVVKIGPGDA